MLDFPTLIFFVTAGCIVILPALCGALGQSRAGSFAITALDQQPKASSSIVRTFIFGTLLNETAAILCVVVGGALLMQSGTMDTTHAWVAPCLALALFCAIALPASLCGLLATRPHAAAITAVARQPLHAGRITSFMMFILPLIQISVIFGLVLSFWLHLQAIKAHTATDAIQLLAGGLAFGLGTVGPLIGMTRLTTTACSSMGAYPATHNAVASLALLSQALIETPVLFALGVAIFITTRASGSSMQFMSAAVAMGLSTLGPGLAAGNVATSACKAIGQQQTSSGQTSSGPASTRNISAASMISQTFIDASALYGVIIAVSLLVFA